MKSSKKRKHSSNSKSSTSTCNLIPFEFSESDSLARIGIDGYLYIKNAVPTELCAIASAEIRSDIGAKLDNDSLFQVLNC